MTASKHVGVNPKIGGKRAPKMDGENHGKDPIKMDFWGFSHIFGNTCMDHFPPNVWKKNHSGFNNYGDFWCPAVDFFDLRTRNRTFLGVESVNISGSKCSFFGVVVPWRSSTIKHIKKMVVPFG